MNRRNVNAASAPAPEGGYSQAVVLEGASRVLYVSGQIPLSPLGVLPATFVEQCRLCWANVLAQLDAAGMSRENLVKVTTYLSDRAFAAENSAIRREVLQDCRPALTILIAGIYDPTWLLEIEAIAAA